MINLSLLSAWQNWALVLFVLLLLSLILNMFTHKLSDTEN